MGRTIRILISDGEQRSALAAVRSLGRAGHAVTVCSASPRPLAGASRYCRRTHLVASPETNPECYLADVERVIDVDGTELLLPMTDVSAPILLRVRATRPYVIVPFPSDATYASISDKLELTRVASGLGVPVPRQLVLNAPGDRGNPLAAFLEEVGCPIVLKPARSAVTTERGTIKVGVTVAGSFEAALFRLTEYPSEAYPILAQEHIRGPGVGVFLLCDRGRSIACFAHERLREKPPSGGVSVYRRSVPLKPDVLAHAERILGEYAWTGVAMVEFKEQASTGVPYLMEVNGRFWGSLQLAIDCGVDFPDLLVRMFQGEQLAPSLGYRIGLRSRWLWGDVDHLIAMLRSPERWRASDPRLPGRLGALARFLVPWRPGDRWEVLRAGDPKPFLRESAQWLRSLVG